MSQAIEISLDNLGRILIPASVQHHLGLSPGMTLVVEKEEKGGVRLSVQPSSPELIDKAGVLAVRAESLANLTNITRNERDRRVFDFI